jgi:hypothetical protein
MLRNIYHTSLYVHNLNLSYLINCYNIVYIIFCHIIMKLISFILVLIISNLFDKLIHDLLHILCYYSFSIIFYEYSTHLTFYYSNQMHKKNSFKASSSVK